MMNNKFDYDSDMKNYYKSDHVAEKYYKAYNKNGGWRERLIANRERKTVESLLHAVPCTSVLDIPTGTGKLAPVLIKSGASVLACDISENMLQIAKTVYGQDGYRDVRFQLCDAERISEEIDENFDVAVCLRLLHRVPTDTKRRILLELGKVASFVIVSTGIESTYHRWRRGLREMLIGGDQRDHCYETFEETNKVITEGFEVIKVRPVLPLISQEYVFLLKPKDG